MDATDFSPFGSAIDGDVSNRKGWTPYPFNEFIFKVQTRCNINCTYCYVYNMGDESWRDQPLSLSPRVAEQAAVRIRDHVRAHGIDGVLVSIHGGEPLLAGVAPIENFVSVVRRVLDGIPVQFSLQTNATLVRSDVARALFDLGVGVGASLDGPEIANRHRVDARGKSSHAAARGGIVELAGQPGLLQGILCVIDIESNPEDVLTHLSSLGAPSLDFLLPHGNWASRPALKQAEQTLGTAAPAPYGKWLAQAFDVWADGGNSIHVRIFDDIIHLLLGGKHSFEGLGLGPARLVVIEADGSIELVDHLGPGHDGAAITGRNVFDHSFDEVLTHPGVICRQIGEQALARECRECIFKSVCGGGLITHRYSPGNGYRNASVYCSDLYYLIAHIKKVLGSRITAARTA